MKYSENLIKYEPQTKQGDYWYTKHVGSNPARLHLFFFRDMFAM